MPLRIDPFGPDALLIRFASEGEAAAFGRGQALLRHLEERPPPGLIEATPGFTTLLLEFEPGTCPEPRVLSVVYESVVRGAKSDPAPARTIEIPVVYDGPDLERVAQRAKLTVEKAVRLHTDSTYRVHLLGFAPGFPYLAGLHRKLHTPRLDTPRPTVPAGSVAIGGEHTGVYPVATAGGWNLIGRTSLVAVDSAGARAGDPAAFYFRPGDAVRFVRVDRL